MAIHPSRCVAGNALADEIAGDKLAILVSCARRREACEEMQGYLIGRPEPIERYSDLIGINVERRCYA